MEKLNLHTANQVDKNIQAIAALFPNTLTERITGYKENGDAIIEYAIDFDVLKQELSNVVVEGAEERYQFTWPDKKKSVLLANAPNYKTLRPCRKESVNFDTTENLYIEGDNLDVLKLLQETYLNQVKMIYIDPPYNTGKDFVYSDDFAQNADEYMDLTEQYDEDGNRLFQNSETNGRYHTDWLNMMYPRLRLAKDLLSEDGVIFISIDDNEAHNLRKMCDEVFGAWNFVAGICHKSRASVSNDKIISPNHNTILFYTKKQARIHAKRKFYGLDPKLDGFDEADEHGEFRYVPVDGPGGAKKGNPYYEFLGINGYWRFSKETMQQKYDDGYVVKRGNSLYQKYYKSTAEQTRRTDTTWWEDAGLMSTATSNLKALMGGETFDTPKPVELIIRMLKLTTFLDKDSIILDFFSGSATTADAVMQLNAEDGGKRKFIMVQLTEEIDEDHEAYKAGYRTICDIGKERIRRAGKKINKKIKEENKWLEPGEKRKKPVDIGFRVLKLDSTNMKDVFYYPGDYDQQKLGEVISNIKNDRTPEDLLFQVMLDLGVLLSCKIEEETINGNQVFVVYQGDIPYLMACFDDNINSETVTAIAKRQPYYAVFRDSGMESDSLIASFEQIFEAYSKTTIRKVL